MSARAPPADADEPRFLSYRADTADWAVSSSPDPSLARRRRRPHGPAINTSASARRGSGGALSGNE